MNFWEMLSKIFAKLLLPLNFRRKKKLAWFVNRSYLQIMTSRITYFVLSLAINLLSLTHDMKQQNVAEFLYLLLD